MIRLVDHHRDRPEQQPHSNRHTREDTNGFRVNWLTQRSQGKEAHPSSQQNVLRDNTHIKQLKLCLRKEINLVPAPQNNEEQQNGTGSTHDVAQYSSGNSQKNSSEKRGKLSLISKRPSLRKISDFISFKDEGEGENKGQEEKQNQVQSSVKKQADPACKKQAKRCIRISSRRQYLAQINKN